MRRDTPDSILEEEARDDLERAAITEDDGFVWWPTRAELFWCAVHGTLWSPLLALLLSPFALWLPPSAHRWFALTVVPAAAVGNALLLAFWKMEPRHPAASSCVSSTGGAPGNTSSPSSVSPSSSSA